ncbi:putative thiazole-containing bacteriocin maturation protein [Bacillus sp. NTK071]|uniref:putative thiazole-containing bacteriocin maturation protein n=1 Tax=Bacillus sp. NTK071 TaxID=2802175 RepID=UPI001A8E7CD3|nr:putative thiazole-containing bacteriocin maturation protein [Bacillus sp. NTK071]MBN8211032.1 putative thiazole-containing bacteriocin maturation protein [Bacillus sp. NTK071]
MTKVNPSMRLKLKKGTFFMPEQNSVYFRNNSGSFRMEGNTIHQWIEKLIPMYNGEYSLASLTDGLPAPYRNRVYEISDSLYTNGFLRDVSKDHPHNLKQYVVEKFAAQIEYIESFCDSGAYRFQEYREQNVLAIGEGPMLIGLVSSLLTSGLSRFHTLLTGKNTSHERIKELEKAARKTDPDVSIEIVLKKEKDPISWDEQIAPFDAILYVSQQGNVTELRNILHVCKEKRKLFIPAICYGEVGVAGPLVNPDSGCWESAWQSMNRNHLKQNSSFSSPAGSMLANVIAFELFKKITGVPVLSNDQVFLLNLETLEGKWHPFKPHPLVTGKINVIRVENVLDEMTLYDEQKDPNELLYYFSQLTSSQLGIFHRWEEGALSQLPLSQCEVQAVNVKPTGNSSLHPSHVSAAMTHEEARREAGLTGIEQYLLPLKDNIISSLPSPLGNDQFTETNLYIGAGATFVEGVSRALQKTIDDEWQEKAEQCLNNLTNLAFDKVEDNLCRYYLKALTTMMKAPELMLGKDTYGFPVVWRKAADNRWYGRVGFNLTLALRAALLQAVKEAQNKLTSGAPSFSTIQFKEIPIQPIVIPAYEPKDQADVLRSVVNLFEHQNKKLSFIKVNLNSFEKDGYLDIYGVLLGRGRRRER